MDKNGVIGVYEFAAVIAPGAVTIFGLSRIYPGIGLLLKDNAISFGEFGLLLILAYATGHLVQPLGHVIEWAWWKLWRGYPTDWPRSDHHPLLAAQQAAILPAKIRAVLQIDCPNTLSTIDERAWSSITRQLYAAVKKAGQVDRIDTFNARYALFRGLAGGFSVIAATAIYECPSTTFLICVGFTLALAPTLSRMHRFGYHYARELFVQFLTIDATNSGTPEKEPSK
ncbi:MAG: hypothetical protein JOZ08_00450 [Verrucomicrobia bacterium]|nr:hypothetical protein [Verrucomicrobiota bacterium]MBV8277469.1 hypothetical protein [Verrucomicrobiota bacterium]